MCVLMFKPLLLKCLFFNILHVFTTVWICNKTLINPSAACCDYNVEAKKIDILYLSDICDPTMVWMEESREKMP